METPHTLSLDNLDVTVAETADALAYTFAPRGSAYRPRFPFFLLFLFVGFPLALLALVAYAYFTVANRPEWEQILTGLFAAQLLVWLVVGTVESCQMIRWSIRGITTGLRFTQTEVRHGADRVCELAEVRGLRLFVYPATRETPDKPAHESEACLSLVIGEDGGTHGLLGGFETQQLRALAEDIHRRLAAFRSNQGMMAALDALSVVETTEDEAGKLMHTRPPQGGLRLFANFGFLMLMNRWVGTPWCLAMLAGLFASGRLVAAGGFNGVFLLGHGLVGFMHFALLVGLWTPQKSSATSETKN